MAVYTQVTFEEIARFAGLYALGTLASAEGITEGVENSNYLLVMKDEGVETRYILTLFEQRTDARDLPFFAGLMEHLAKQGIDCPKPLANREGELLGKLAGKPALIVSFLEGQSVSMDEARPIHLEQLGVMMARMHLAAQEFSIKRANALSFSGWLAIADKVGERFEQIATGLTQHVRDELRYLKDAWNHDLPSGVIHADLFVDNVFFKQDILSGIIDFYFACNDSFAYDLAITTNAWCFDAQQNFIIERQQALLKGYESVRLLSGVEHQSLPVMCRGAALRFLLTRAHDMLFPVEGAQVVIKDPMEYARKLKFFQSMQ